MAKISFGSKNIVYQEHTIRGGVEKYTVKDSSGSRLVCYKNTDGKEYLEIDGKEETDQEIISIYRKRRMKFQEHMGNYMGNAFKNFSTGFTFSAFPTFPQPFPILTQPNIPVSVLKDNTLIRIIDYDGALIVYGKKDGEEYLKVNGVRIKHPYPEDVQRYRNAYKFYTENPDPKENAASD